MEGGYSLNRGEAHAGIGMREAIVGSAALDSESVRFCLELAYGGLYLLEFDIGVMVILDVGRQPPVLECIHCLNEEVKGGLVGRHALDKPEGEDVRGGVGDDGGEGLELMGVNAGVSPSKGTLGQVGSRDVANVVGEEVHAILADVEIGHEPVVIGEVRGAVRCEEEGGSGVGVGEVTLQLCELLLELGKGLLEIGSGLEVSLGGDVGIVTDATELDLGGGVAILGQLSKFFHQSNSSFAGYVRPMDVKGSTGGARGGGSVSQESLDGEVVIRLEMWGDIEGCDVFGGKGDLDFWTRSGLEGGLGGH